MIRLQLRIIGPVPPMRTAATNTDDARRGSIR